MVRQTVVRLMVEKNEHLSVGIGGGWINENEVNFHLCFVNGDDYI